MSFYEVNENTTIFVINPEQTMFKNVANFQKVMLVLHGNSLIFDTLEEKFTFKLDDIKEVSFFRIGSALVTKIATSRGNFVGSQGYKQYKSKASKEIFKFLKDKISDSKQYDNLLKSKFELTYALFGK